MPLVSVIIPTYNRPIQLENALISVLFQTFTDFEILVVNDWIDDNSVLELLNRIGDNRIKYFKNERTKGACGARNTGILKANGKFIALLDDDDEWMPRKLEAQVVKMRGLGSNWGGCYCGFRRKDITKWNNYLNLKEGDILRDYLINRLPVCGGSTLFFLKETLNRVGLFDERLERHQDVLFIINFLRYYKLGFINELLAKINGQNFPSAIKVERSKRIIFSRIKQDVQNLKKIEIKKYYSFQYLELTFIFLFERDYRKTIYYLKKSLSYKVFMKMWFLKYVIDCIRFGLRYKKDH